MQQRRLGSSGLSVSRLGLGTMTWGRDTDEHEARDQLVAFVEAGGTLRRHRRRLHRRRLRAAARLAPRRRRRPRRGGAGDQGRHLAPPRRRASSTPRAATCSRSLDASLAPARASTTSTCGRSTPGPTSAPLEETLAALDHAVTTGRAAYVGVSNYTGWQTAQAATWQRAAPGRTPAGLDPGRVLPAQPRRRARGAARRGRARARACCAWSPLGRGVLTGKYRAGTPADSRGASPVFSGFVGAYLDDDSARRGRGGGARGRRPGLDAAGGGAGLGARPARGHARRSSAPAPPPSCAPRWAARTRPCPREIAAALDDVSEVAR